eukprot:CAMPEP_0114562770 /NCGR_PEP_ID=MMETSP0114-20121206/12715_1 /TAXON_ID=31324 /ORGANISM="Goniomonas sp, Strain m" /LENGTH=52 /DNA_ID=CAMNT_0001748495 /DNA_START=39 /DNA_END=197 /DNA_ORIENTATION=-
MAIELPYKIVMVLMAFLFLVPIVCKIGSTIKNQIQKLRAAAQWTEDDEEEDY